MTTAIAPTVLEAVYRNLKDQFETMKTVQVSLTDFTYDYDGYTHTLTQKVEGEKMAEGFEAFDANAGKVFEFTTDTTAFTQFAKTLKMPAAAVKKSSTDIARSLVQDYLRRLEKPNVLVMTDADGTVVRGFLPVDYMQIGNHEVFGAAKNAIPDATLVKVIGGGWQDVKTAFIVAKATGYSITYGTEKEPITADISVGVQVTCSELGGKKITMDPVLVVNGRFIAIGHDKTGNYYSVKTDDYNGPELTSLIRSFILATDTQPFVQTLQAEALKKLEDTEIREWVTDLCRYKGASNSIIKKLEKNVESIEGEAVQLLPMAPTELALHILFLIQNLDKPLGLGLERGLGYKLGINLD
jgi:hypothetical protein